MGAFTAKVFMAGHEKELSADNKLKSDQRLCTYICTYVYKLVAFRTMDNIYFYVDCFEMDLRRIKWSICRHRVHTKCKC